VNHSSFKTWSSYQSSTKNVFILIVNHHVICKEQILQWSPHERYISTQIGSFQNNSKVRLNSKKGWKLVLSKICYATFGVMWPPSRLSSMTELLCFQMKNQRTVEITCYCLLKVMKKLINTLCSLSVFNICERDKCYDKEKMYNSQCAVMCVK